MILTSIAPVASRAMASPASTISANYDWRFSAKNMHKIEDHLRAIPHQKLRSSDRRYEYWHERYQKYKQRFPIVRRFTMAIAISGCCKVW